MTITKGFWRTRDGRKAEAVDVRNGIAIGRIDSTPFCWNEKGTTREPFNCTTDLTEPWIDKPEWDWSTTPPWMNWLAMDAGNYWYLYKHKPKLSVTIFSAVESDDVWFIPKQHAPKWSGDFKDSLVGRPGAEKPQS